MSKTQTGKINHDFLAVGINYHGGSMIKSNIYLGSHPLAQKHFVQILGASGPKTQEKDRRGDGNRQVVRQARGRPQTGSQTGKGTATDR